MHVLFNDLLRLMKGCLDNESAMLILWDYEFHISMDDKNEIKNHFSTDFLFLQKYFNQAETRNTIQINKSTNPELFRNLVDTESKNECTNFFGIPIINDNQKSIGIIGYTLAHSDQMKLQSIEQIQTLASHINNLVRHNLNLHEQASTSKPLYLDSLDQLPGAHFEYHIDKKGSLTKFYVSREAAEINKYFSQLNDIDSLLKKFEIIHQRNFKDFKNFFTLNKIHQSIEYGFPITLDSGEKNYFIIKINSFKDILGNTICLGVLKDISFNKIYENILEQIIFDITHVMRRPVATMLGLTSLIETDKIDPDSIKDVAQKLRIVSAEMDNYIKQLYNDYQKKYTDYEKCKEG